MTIGNTNGLMENHDTQNRMLDSETQSQSVDHENIRKLSDLKNDNIQWKAAAPMAKPYAADLSKLSGIDERTKESFFEAVEEGDVNKLKTLLENGFDVNTTDDYRNNAVWYAVQKGNLEMLHFLADNNADFNNVNEWGNNAAWQVLESIDDVDKEEFLIALKNGGLDLDAMVGGKGKGIQRTLAHIAVIMQDVSGLKALKETGANLNLKNENNMTPLEFAKSELEKLRGSEESGGLELDEDDINIKRLNDIVAFLENDVSNQIGAKKANGVGKEKVVDDNDIDQFFKAADEGNLEVLKQLLAKGVDVNEVDLKGNTAVHHMAEKGHLEGIKFLASKNADFTKENSGGRNAAWMVLFSHQKAEKKTNILKALRDGGLNLDALVGPKKNKTLAHSMVTQARHNGLLGLIGLNALKEAGATFDQKSGTGKTPLEFARSESEKLLDDDQNKKSLEAVVALFEESNKG